MGGTVFIIPAIIAALLATMSVFLLNGKGAFLIAGYNTLKKSEQAKYDEKALCRFTGRLLIIISPLLLLVPIGIYFEATWLSLLGAAVLAGCIAGAIIYMNSGNRFRRSGPEMPTLAADSKAAPWNARAVIIFVCVVVAAVGIMIYQGGKETVVTVSDSGIQIKGMYGLSVGIADITDITLIDKSMSEIGAGSMERVNGYGGFGQALKGQFRSDSLGDILLFVQSETPPTIRIETVGKSDIYISFRDGDKTEQLYRSIISMR